MKLLIIYSHFVKGPGEQNQVQKEGKKQASKSRKKSFLIQVEATGHTQEGRQNQADKNRQGAGQENKTQSHTRVKPGTKSQEHFHTIVTKTIWHRSWQRCALNRQKGGKVITHR